MPRVKLSSAARLIVDESGVILHSEFGTFVLEGHQIADFTKQIVPLLDGSRNRNEILEAFPHLRSNTEALLQILDRRGMLNGVEDQPDDLLQNQLKAQERFFRAWSDSHEDLTRRLRDSRVLIVRLEPGGIVAASQLAASGVGSLHLADDGILAASDLPFVDPLLSDAVGCSRREALAQRLSKISPWCSVTTSSESDAKGQALAGHWDLLIGSMSPDDLAGSFQWARVAHEANIVSFFGSSNAVESIIGPLVIPGQTACWNCARLRMLANAECSWAAHAVQHELLAGTGTRSTRAALLPATFLSGNLVSLEALKVLSGYAKSRFPGHVMIQNLITLKTSFHEVIPMPWCETCGGAAKNNRPGRESSGPDWSNDAQHLRQSLSGWLDSRTGVISRVVMRKLETFDSLSFFCAQALQANYTEGQTPADAVENCGGKGLTECEAIIGAVGEALERYSASRFRVGEMLRASLPGSGSRFLDPRSLCLYEESQYDRPNFPFVRFDREQTHLWTRGHWLDNGQEVWVPALMTYYNFPAEADQPFCQVTSNGLAAGVSLEDAALRAVMELVERDAFMISWLCRRPGRRLRLGDSLDPRLRPVYSQLEECGARLELYLLEAGLDIPVIVCLGLGDGKRWPGLTVSSAAHLSPRLAVRNAILEHAYSGVYLRHLMLGRKAAVPATPEQVRNWSFLDHGLYYLPPERAAACDFLRTDEGATDLSSLKEPTNLSLDHCSTLLTLAGVRVAIADVTAPDVAQSPFRVVRALGINMQPIHCGYGMERLANPRLKRFLNGRVVNRDVHPLC